MRNLRKRSQRRNKNKPKPQKEYYDLSIGEIKAKPNKPLWIGTQKYNESFPIYKFLVEKSVHQVDEDCTSAREQWQEFKTDIQNEHEFAESILSWKNKREWLYEYVALCSSKGGTSSFQTLSIHGNLIQVYEQFNWLVWAIGYYYFENKFDEQFGLPPHSEDAWTEGFIWRGVYFRLLPVQHAYLIKREVEAIKHITLELEECFSLESNYSKRFDIDISESYHRKIIPPLLSVSEGGSFLIYGTPGIPIQKMNKSNPTVSINNLQKREDIDLSESMLQLMPTLSELTPENLVPLNFEDFEEKYVIVNGQETLTPYLPDIFSKGIIRIPEDNEEEISIYQYPTDGSIPLEELFSLFEGKVDENNDDHSLTEKGN